MTRMMRSSVLLAACLGLWSCTNDPTADEAGVPTAIVSNPTVNFVTQGQSQLITFGLVDELGGLIPSTWTISNVSPEISVTFDSTYRVVYKNGDSTLSLPDMQSQIRVTVNGLAGGSASLTVSASGVSQNVLVNVVPTSVPATITPSSSMYGDTVVVTMPAGYSLAADASFVSGIDEIPGLVFEVAADGSSAKVALPPGISSPLTISGVMVAFLPGTPLTIPTVASASRASQGDYTIAGVLPALPTAVGGTLTFSDAYAEFEQFYQFTVTQTTTLQITTSWEDGDNDYDVAFWDDTGAFICYCGSFTGSMPEVSTHQFAPGTYYVSPEFYSGVYSPITMTFEVLSVP